MLMSMECFSLIDSSLNTMNMLTSLTVRLLLVKHDSRDGWE